MHEIYGVERTELFLQTINECLIIDPAFSDWEKLVLKDKNDLKLYISLMLWSLLPSIYLLLRMKIVAVNNVDINILGQIEWFDLIDETIATALIVPLYSILKPSKSSANKVGFAFIVSFLIYFVFTIVIASKISTISKFMQAEYATSYLFLQTFSMLIQFISTFMILVLTLNNASKEINTLIISKLICLSAFDFIFIITFNNIGAAYSEIIANLIIAAAAFTLVRKHKYISFMNRNNNFVKKWIERGIPVCVQIFLDNFIYAVMIIRMVNVVNESGNYWVAYLRPSCTLMPRDCSLVRVPSMRKMYWVGAWAEAATSSTGTVWPVLAQKAAILPGRSPGEANSGASGFLCI